MAEIDDRSGVADGRNHGENRAGSGLRGSREREGPADGLRSAIRPGEGTAGEGLEPGFLLRPGGGRLKLEMEVRPARVAGRPDEADLLPGRERGAPDDA